VNQSVPGEVLEPRGGLTTDFARIGDRQWTPRPNEPGKIDAVHQIHDEICNAVGLSGIGGPHDIRVIELSECGHLAMEPGLCGGVACSLGRNDLHRHFAIQSSVNGTVDVTHSATSEQLENAVFAESFRHGLVIAVLVHPWNEDAKLFESLTALRFDLIGVGLRRNGSEFGDKDIGLIERRVSQCVKKCLAHLAVIEVCGKTTDSILIDHAGVKA